MKTLLIAAISSAALLAQTVKVNKVELRTEPSGAKVRPMESIVLQVRSYGEITGAEDKKQQVRLRRAAGKVRVADQNGGWISKPFKFQGKDDEKFHEESQKSWQSILTAASGQFLVKDSVLYTAPEQPGTYTIEASVEDGQSGKIAIEVTPSAASTRKPERSAFDKEAASSDPYRRLAEHYSPFIAQESWFQPKSDTPARFDYDGDWNGGNNWDNLEDGSSQAYVYYAAMETGTHWFLTYNVFHPRDYSDNCVAGMCHENDNEGIFLTIRKDGSEFGNLQVMETLAHNNVYSYTRDNSIRNGVHDIDGSIDLHDNSHPMIFIESGGHGIYAVGDNHSVFDASKQEFREGTTGMTLIYKGSAERPRHAADRLVGYDLLPIHDHWWKKTCQGRDWKENTFDEFYAYQPFGGRPAAKCSPVSGAFYGRKMASNKARPFWGWFDDRTRKKKVLNTGQWGLDPAYAVSQNLRFPAGQQPSLDYTFNPYLGFGLDRAAETPVSEARPATPAEITPAPETPAQPSAPPEATEGTCELTAMVDGVAVAHIAGDKVEFTVESGQPVGDSQLKCTAPIPAASLSDVNVEKRAGRGKATLSGRPGLANGYAVDVRIEDPARAADRYTVFIRWRK